MIYSINFLRFIAALAVVVSHTANVLALAKPADVGDAGVDIFFIISGFVIGFSGSRYSAAGFLARRFIRVFPLYWIALALAIAVPYVRWGVLPSVDAILHSVSLVPSLTGEWAFILFPAWTLTFEAAFYLIFALMLVLDRKRSSALCIFSLVFFATLPSSIFAGPTLWPLFAEFIFGLLVALNFERLNVGKRRLGIFAIGLAMAGFGLFLHVPSHRVLSWGLLSLLFVLGLLQFESARLLRNRFVVLLGNASYALYLFHIPVMTIVREASSAFGFDLRHHEAIGPILLVLVSIGAAIFVHLVVENPVLRYLRAKLVPSRSAREPSGDQHLAT